jgi:hypothetical protein
MYLADTQGLLAARQGWRDIARMIDWVCENTWVAHLSGYRLIQPGVRLDSAHYRSSETKRS